MAFRLVDRKSWVRESLFRQFMTETPCTWSMTVSVDVSPILETGERLYPSLIYLLSAGVNAHEEFRYALDADGQPGIYDALLPSYTLFDEQTETFSCLHGDCSGGYRAFLATYEENRRLHAQGCRQLLSDMPKNIFSISMIPWESFTSFNLNLGKGFTWLAPIFTLGKYTLQNGSAMLPLAIQVHHAVCDGFHVCRLLNELRAAIAAWPETARM